MVPFKKFFLPIYIFSVVKDKTTKTAETRNSLVQYFVKQISSCVVRNNFFRGV